eukprot:310920-Chlamydomonas_euryale.AAC.1
MNSDCVLGRIERRSCGDDGQHRVRPGTQWNGVDPIRGSSPPDPSIEPQWNRALNTLINHLLTTCGIPTLVHAGEKVFER